MHGTWNRWALSVCLVAAGFNVGWADPLTSKEPGINPAHFTELVRQLGSEDFYEREAASEELEKMGEPIMEELRQVSETSPDLEVQHRADVIVDRIEVQLKLTKAPASSEVLIERLRQSKYPSYRAWSAQQLAYVQGASRGAAVEALVAACRTDDAPKVRLACIKTLERMKVGTPPVIQAIQVLTRDKDSAVRDQAVRTYTVLPRLVPPPK